MKLSNRLTSVYITHSKLGNNGLAILSQGIKQNKSLTLLDIFYNFIGDSGLKSLQEVLSADQHAPLKTLVFQDFDPQFSDNVVEDLRKLGLVVVKN